MNAQCGKRHDAVRAPISLFRPFPTRRRLSSDSPCTVPIRLTAHLHHDLLLIPLAMAHISGMSIHPPTCQVSSWWEDCQRTRDEDQRVAIVQGPLSMQILSEDCCTVYSSAQLRMIA